MKKLNYLLILTLVVTISGMNLYAQAPAKNDLLLSMGYYNNNNLQQYLVAHAKTKIDGKFQMVPDLTLSFYITNDSSANNLLGTALTDAKGNAYLPIPATAQAAWKKGTKQDFVIVSKTNKLYDESKANVTINKAKLKIDTAADRKIIVTAYELKDTTWTIVKGVELKVAIKRQGGDLNVSETQTYTTDSTGTVTAEFKHDSLAGNSKGFLTLVAKVEENDTYGNLTAETVVPWGAPTVYNTAYDKRTLFARRGHSPIWLEAMAYSIIVAVWGILIFLVVQIRKMRQMGA